MVPDQDDFAIIVTAQQFQLVDSSGNVVANFVNTINPPTDLHPALVFQHNATEYSDLEWSRGAAGGTETLELNGPNTALSPIQLGIQMLSTFATNDGAMFITANGDQITLGNAGAGINITTGFRLNLAGGTEARLAAVGNVRLAPFVPAGGHVLLNARTAAMLIAAATVVATADLAIPTVGTGVAPGTTIAINANAGDLLVIHSFYDFDSGAVGGFMSGDVLVNGAQVGVGVFEASVGGQRATVGSVGTLPIAATGVQNISMNANSSVAGQVLRAGQSRYVYMLYASQ